MHWALLPVHIHLIINPLLAARPEVEPTILRSQIQHPNRYTFKPQALYIYDWWWWYDDDDDDDVERVTEAHIVLCGLSTASISTLRRSAGSTPSLYVVCDYQHSCQLIYNL